MEAMQSASTMSDSDADSQDLHSDTSDSDYDMEDIDLLQSYQDLKAETQRKYQDIVEPETDELFDLLEKQNYLRKRFKKAKGLPSSDADVIRNLDAAQCATLAHLAKVKALSIEKEGFIDFRTDEFVQKLIRFAHGQEASPPEQTLEEGLTSKQWGVLGESAQVFFKRSPTLTYMYGALDKLPTEGMDDDSDSDENEYYRDSDEDLDMDIDESLAQHVQGVDVYQRQHADTDKIEHIFATLQHLYDYTNGSPICFFEFVLDNHSYGKTIENMFYVSYLVRDGHVRISLDADRLPIIEPVDYVNFINFAANAAAPRHQALISMSYTEWKELVRTFDIVHPLICDPPRICVRNKH